MTDLNKALQFKDLMYHALKSKWCVKPYCTTCGSFEFRDELKKFSNDEIIEGLKILPAEFMELEGSTDALCICFYTASIFGVGGDLQGPLKGTPVALVLRKVLDCNKLVTIRIPGADGLEGYQAIKPRTTKESQLCLDDFQRYALYEKQNRLDLIKIEAQKNIWHAIKRKDIKAIKALIDKGINQNEKNEDGKSIKDLLVELNIYE